MAGSPANTADVETMTIALREMEVENASLRAENANLRTASAALGEELQNAESDTSTVFQSLNASLISTGTVSAELRREEAMRQQLVNRHQASTDAASRRADAERAAVATELGLFEDSQRRHAATAIAERELVLAELGTADFELALARRRERAIRQQQQQQEQQREGESPGRLQVASSGAPRPPRADGVTSHVDDDTGPSGDAQPPDE